MNAAQMRRAVQIIDQLELPPAAIVSLTEFGSEGCLLRIGANTRQTLVARIMIDREGFPHGDDDAGDEMCRTLAALSVNERGVAISAEQREDLFKLAWNLDQGPRADDPDPTVTKGVLTLFALIAGYDGDRVAKGLMELTRAGVDK